MDYLLYGSVLSPFSMKVRAALRRLRVPHREVPAQGSVADRVWASVARERLVRGLARPTAPALDPLDELPLVPSLFGPRGESLVDSSAILRWLDARHPRSDRAPLVPRDPASRFVAHVLDEAFDELGLYALHHQRWVVSARSTRAPELVAREYAGRLPRFAQSRIATHFGARQVRRLPYLFSVAPEGLHLPGLPESRQPPSRRGFPPTHALLDSVHAALLRAVEDVLRAQPFLLGDACTVADLSLVGGLASHRWVDPQTWSSLRATAPYTAAWVEALDAGEAAPREPARAREASVHPGLGGVLAWATDLFLPLMLENERAFERFGGGEARDYNERAFDAGRGLYDGVLGGAPYRSVVKTFQVRVLRDLRAAYAQLDPSTREALLALAPGLDALRSRGNARARP